MQQKKICFLRIGKMSFISNEIFYDITFNISYSIIVYRVKNVSMNIQYYIIDNLSDNIYHDFAKSLNSIQVNISTIINTAFASL